MKLKKSLGQNFLTDSFFLEKIVHSSQIQKIDDVIEIGPGNGALTEHILKCSNNVKAIEIDHRFNIILINFHLLSKKHQFYLSQYQFDQYFFLQKTMGQLILSGH